MLEIKYTATMKRDLKRIVKQGKDVSKLQMVLELLAAGQTLERKYQDHQLSGNKKSYRECHIESDWLLVYQIQQYELILLAAATGSHADLLGI